MTFTQIRALEKENVMQTYGRFERAFDHGANATLFDTEGRAYIDFTSGIGVNSIGAANPAWVAAVSQQAAKLAHISNLYYTEPMARLAASLCGAAHMKRVFFANSGAEANEGAIKIARKYSFDKYGAGRDVIMTLQNSFHGRTVTTLSATGQDHFHNYFFPFTEGFAYTPAEDIGAMESAIKAESVCAVMLELVQGESGVLPLSKEFVAETARLCRENDVLLIVDEVQTGVGRTGHFLACEAYGIAPDIITLAKGLGGGLPIGAVLAGETCAGTLGASDHGSTFGGNPMSAAGANVVMDTVCCDSFLSDVRKKGAHLMDAIRALNAPAVHEVRGLGLMVGIVVDDGAQKKYASAALEHGLLVLTAGRNVIRLLPPLTITYEELDHGIQILSQVLQTEVK